jgi:hypothetical protein
MDTLASLTPESSVRVSCMQSVSLSFSRSHSDKRFAESPEVSSVVRKDLEPFVQAMVAHATSLPTDPTTAAVGKLGKREYPLTLFDLTLDPLGWESWFLMFFSFFFFPPFFFFFFFFFFSPSSYFRQTTQFLVSSLSAPRYHYGPLASFPTYGPNETGVYALVGGDSAELLPAEISASGFAQTPFASRSGIVTIGVAADWGSGTRESALVSHFMSRHTPDVTMHLGDVYYVGAAQEFDSNVFGIAPEGVEHGVEWHRGPTASFLTAGNHELYDSRAPIYTKGMAWAGLRRRGVYVGQRATYVALVNEHWRVVMLDTGYHSYKKDQITPATEDHNNTQPEAVVEWMTRTLTLTDASDTRGLILMFHHQMYSAFSGDYLATPNQLAKILPPGIVPLIFYGHEHRLSFYDPHEIEGLPASFQAYCRCIGNGGYPVSIRGVPAAHPGLTMYDDREMSDELGLDFERHGWNGYTMLAFNKDQVTAEYYTLAPDAGGNPKRAGNTTETLMVSETFATAPHGGVELKSVNFVNPEMRVVSK